MNSQSLISIFLAILLVIIFPLNQKASAAVYFNEQDIEYFLVDQMSLIHSSFNLAEQSDTIKAYEMFLDSSGKYADGLFSKFDTEEFKELDRAIDHYNYTYSASIPSASYVASLNEKAVDNIYSEVQHADLIEGYQYFIQKYPNSIHVQEAINRLYLIAYAVAEENNDLSSYIGFLTNFKAAPEELQTAALDHAADLQCSAAYADFESELQSIPEDQRENLFYQEFINDRLARRLYDEAIEAKNRDDLIDFQLKYNAILSCDLFSDSSAKFSLQLNSELKEVLKGIEKKIIALRNDIGIVKHLLVGKLNKIQENQDQQSAYLNDIRRIIEVQNKKPDARSKPSFCWNDAYGVWGNVYNCGTLAINAVNDVVVPTSELIATLSKYKI